MPFVPIVEHQRLTVHRLRPSGQDSGRRSLLFGMESEASALVLDHLSALEDMSCWVAIADTPCVLSSPVPKSVPFLADVLVRLTYGRPQYVHQQICGLSTLMNILG
jgi:hypothetical protein